MHHHHGHIAFAALRHHVAHVHLVDGDVASWAEVAQLALGLFDLLAADEKAALGLQDERGVCSSHVFQGLSHRVRGGGHEDCDRGTGQHGQSQHHRHSFSQHVQAPRSERLIRACTSAPPRQASPLDLTVAGFGWWSLSIPTESEVRTDARREGLGKHSSSHGCRLTTMAPPLPHDVHPRNLFATHRCTTPAWRHPVRWDCDGWRARSRVTRRRTASFRFGSLEPTRFASGESRPSPSTPRWAHRSASSPRAPRS